MNSTSLETTGILTIKPLFFIAVAAGLFFCIQTLSGQILVMRDEGRCYDYYDGELHHSYVTPDGEIRQFDPFVREFMNSLDWSKELHYLVTDYGNLVIYFYPSGK